MGRVTDLTQGTSLPSEEQFLFVLTAGLTISCFIKIYQAGLDNQPWKIVGWFLLSLFWGVGLIAVLYGGIDT